MEVTLKMVSIRTFFKIKIIIIFILLYLDKPGSASMTTVASLHLEELKKELEEYKELSGNRLQEIEKLNEEKAQFVNEIDKLKMEMRHLPESVIVETTEYKILQSQFSVLYNESMQINTMLDEARAQLAKSKTEYQRYIEYLESNELDEQKKLRNELLQKQYVLDQTRKEFENLRNKYEQNLAANEQTAPINREMRQLITSLQNRNGQFKKEIQRYKRKYKDISADNTKLRKELEEMSNKMNAAGVKQEKDIKNESASSITEDEPSDVKNVKDESSLEKIKTETEENDSENEDKSSLTSNDKISTAEILKKEESTASSNVSNVAKLERESRELKAQLKKALNDLKDTKVVMDTYKGVSKEQRDKVQLMAAEKKARQELEEVKLQLKKIQETKREDRKDRDRRADEDVLRKLKQLEDKNCELQKQLSAQKAVDGQWGYRPFVGSNVVCLFSFILVMKRLFIHLFFLTGRRSTLE
jgi:E3 ubiquitin-protein ligase BRE1